MNIQDLKCYCLLPGILVCLLLLYSLEMLVFWVNNLKATSGLTIPLAEQTDGHLRTHSLLTL